MWVKLHAEGSVVTVCWGAARGPYPKTYRIGRASLEAAADAIKRHLQQLSAWYQNKAAVNLGMELQGLARAGSNLRSVLFSPLPDASGNPVDISGLRDWYQQKRSTDRRLFVSSSPYLHIPWALIFEGKVPTGGNPLDPRNFSSFWCMSYELSTIFHGHSIPEDQLARRADNVYLISALHRNVFATTLTHLRQQNSMLADDIESLLNTPLGPTFTVEACSDCIARTASKDTIFHFFGHGRAGSLDLGSEQINAIEFKQLMDGLTKRRDEVGSDSCSLLILNACESMLGQGDYTVRAASAVPGVCGLIAAEAEVPAQFALRFSHRFLDALLRRGRSIGQIMTELRSDPTLWPMILLYGCYAEPDYRFT